jgi:chloramphenicol 3-O-phosphotransferase
MADILVLTGPPASGKSSVAEALAERYDRVAHVEVDTLRHFITPTGYIPPGRPGFERQQALAVRNACALAANFIAERIAVIIDDVIVTEADLSLYLDGLKAAAAPVHVVRLMPRVEVCLERNRTRREGRMNPERVETVYREMAAVPQLRGVTIDNSELTAYQTSDKLQALTTSGQSLVS